MMGNHKQKYRRTLSRGAVLLVAVVATVGVPTLVTAIARDILLNRSEVSDIRVGSTPINTVYVGNDLVWERTAVSIADLTYLQDLALPQYARFCERTPNGVRATLMDRRNGQPYYVQKIASSAAGGKDACWMETNLRYGGDGSWSYTWGYPDDRYADSDDSDGVTAAQTANANDNIRPLTVYSSGYYGGGPVAAPTVAAMTDAGVGGSTNYINTAAIGGFYGYLYNWCTAMGGQANTCNNTSTSGIDARISICPSGWRLPVGGTVASTNDFVALMKTTGATNDATGSASLRDRWLAVYAGGHTSNLYQQGERGSYWTSTTSSSRGGFAHVTLVTPSEVTDSTGYTELKGYGFSIRCLAQ